MRFSEAMKHLEEGKKIRCCGWDRGSFWVNHDDEPTHWSDSKYRIDRMMDEDWELYEEPQKTYSFMEVVAALKEGKSFKRKSWISAVLPIKCFRGGLVLNDFGIPHLTIQDLEATDWIEVKE